MYSTFVLVWVVLKRIVVIVHAGPNYEDDDDDEGGVGAEDSGKKQDE